MFSVANHVLTECSLANTVHDLNKHFICIRNTLSLRPYLGRGFVPVPSSFAVLGLGVRELKTQNRKT